MLQVHMVDLNLSGLDLYNPRPQSNAETKINELWNIWIDKSLYQVLTEFNLPCNKADSWHVVER